MNSRNKWLLSGSLALSLLFSSALPLSAAEAVAIKSSSILQSSQSSAKRIWIVPERKVRHHLPSRINYERTIHWANRRYSWPWGKWCKTGVHRPFTPSSPYYSSVAAFIWARNYYFFKGWTGSASASNKRYLYCREGWPDFLSLPILTH